MRKNLLISKGMKWLLWLIPLCGSLSGKAQGYNIAPVASTPAPSSNQRGDGIGANGPCWALNDGYVGTFPGTTFAGVIAFDGSLEYSWQESQTFNKIRFYNADYPLSTCTIEYDNGSGYQLLTNYTASGSMNADSITFAAVTAKKVRFSKVRGAGKGQAASLREIEIWHAPASGNVCPTTVTAGVVYPAEQSLCLGHQAILVAGDYSFSDNIAYQWQVNSGGSWQDIAGATNSWYSFRVTTATPADAYYRLKVSCGGNTAYTAQTARVRVTGGHNAVYASLPYFENFEADWKDGCGTGDIPSDSWITNPVSGPHIWKSSSAYSRKETPFPDAPNGTKSARFGSSFKSATDYLGHMDLHVNCSAPTGDKLLYFYYVNQPDPKGESYPEGNDVLTIQLSKDGGASFEPLAVFTTQDVWGLKTVPIVSNAANTIIRFSGRTQTATGARDQSDIGVDSIYIAPPCSGSVTAGTVLPSGKICPGTTVALNASGSSQGGGIHYQWEQSANGSSGWANATGGSGATAPIYQTPALFTPIYYRLKVTCENGNDSKTTAAVKVDMEAPTYAALPFTERFEQWTKRCDTINEIPSKSWVNTPATGVNSWRRDDEGNHPWGFTTQWNPSTGTFIFYDWNASDGKYTPVAFEGEHIARFHTNGNTGKIGKLDLFVDCSKQTGDKELSFALNLTKDIPATGNNPNPAPNGYDYLNVYLSTDGGANFSFLDKFEGPAFSSWEIKNLTFSSNSATTVLRFEAVSVSGYKDMGLDYVRVLPACTETPVAGTIDSVSACLDTDFFLKLSGNTQAGGMKYQWQRATGPSGPWINMPGTSSGIYTTQIKDTTWFRAIVTCIGSAKADTTPVRKISPSPFYYCYCKSGYNSELTLNNNFGSPHFGKNVGNITLINNGTDTVLNSGDYKDHYSYPSADFKAYTDFRYTVKPAKLYLDSLYKFIVHAIYSSTVGSNPVKWAAYIDYNRDGTFDTINERIWIDLNNNQDTRFGGIPWTAYNFKVPADVPTGITGLRIVMMGGGGTRIQDWNQGPRPCGEFGDGETEDYLVSIEKYPCTEAPAAGAISTKDLLMCPGYELQLADSGRGEYLPTAGGDWQYSKDGTSWMDIANSGGRDTIAYTYTEPTSFRFRTYCGNVKDTAYSNVIRVQSKEPYQCYCYSTATGKDADTSDIGQIKVRTYSFGEDGPHLNNTNAIYGRTDNTDTTMVFYADSTYQVTLNHILRAATHADAKVTLFMDYNNNLAYDKDELVWTGRSTASGWNLDAAFTIPSDVKTEVKTGMRLILNNDTEPNVPSDEACGGYISGETEDFVVMFYKEDPVNGVRGAATTIRDLKLYPNPANNKVFLQYFGEVQRHAALQVLNISGQQVQTYPLADLKNGQIVELDVQGLAQGMYFVRMHAGSHTVTRKLSLIRY